jgi:hypothetical protein
MVVRLEQRHLTKTNVFFRNGLTGGEAPPLPSSSLQISSVQTQPIKKFNQY